MFNFLRSVLIITLIVASGYILYSMATEKAAESLKTLHVSADGTATVIGTVLANKSDCKEQNIDPRCFLKLRVGTKDVYVVYNADDNSLCSNETATTMGKNIRQGSTVKVRGFYRQEKNIDTILTCPNTEYFIQNI